jgi:Ran GTPase-activating protein (RanGAP) involved in mRNA processing and transport
VALAQTLRLNTTLASLNLRENGLGEGGGWVLAEALRLNTTLASLNLYYNGLGEGGGRALAEALRLNAMLTSLNLGANGLRVEVRAALRQRVQVRSALGQAWGPIGEGHWIFRFLLEQANYMLRRFVRRGRRTPPCG